VRRYKGPFQSVGSACRLDLRPRMKLTAKLAKHPHHHSIDGNDYQDFEGGHTIVSLGLERHHAMQDVLAITLVPLCDGGQARGERINE